MQCISDGIGSGATKEFQISECINESWCEFLSVNVKLQTSQVLLDSLEWKCKDGFTPANMKMLNDEFNFFRGLFPLKVLISGPPCSGKTHFASKLSEQYGIPHITIQDIIDMGNSLTNEYGQKLKARVEELIDQAEAEYEKTRKKKDPDFDRSTCHPRLPDDIISDLVRLQLNSAACQNKGFILDGYPRSKADAQEVFMDKIPIPSESPEGEDAEGAEEPE